MRVPWRALNQRINALVAVNEQIARIGPHEIAVAIKDNICTADLPTTCSSAILEGFRSPFDATVVRLLRKTPNVRIVGKTNCDEFGMGSLSVHSSHGPVINPFDLDCPPRSAGGSSGGSAAAVAAGLCDVALATDTGGSTRLPASYCGIVGFKPSYGLLSRWGLVSYADSLDCIGIMSKEVEKTRQIFHVLNKHDTKDPTSIPSDVRQKVSDIFNVQNLRSESTGRFEHTLAGLRVGIPQEYFPSELSPHIKLLVTRAAAILEAEGAIIVPVSLPSTPYALSAYYVIASAEASSNLARFDGVRYGLHVPPPRGSDLSTTSNVYAHTRSRGFGREARKRILLGTYALTADAFDNYFLQALKIRQLVRDDFNKVFRAPNILSASATNSNESGVDVLLHPSAIQTAPLLESDHVSKLDTYVQDVLTVPASLAGLPALSVPIRHGPSEDEKHDSWPMGLSIVGQWGSDELVLEVGNTIERRQLRA